MFPANRIATSYKSSTHGILDNFKPIIYDKRATQAEGVRFCLHLTLGKPSLIFKELQPYLRKEKKYKADILKYVRHILNYVRHISRQV